MKRSRALLQECRHLSGPLLLSLLLHALLLTLSLDGDGGGFPGLRLPWQERRVAADALYVVQMPRQALAGADAPAQEATVPAPANTPTALVALAAPTSPAPPALPSRRMRRPPAPKPAEVPAATVTPAKSTPTPVIEALPDTGPPEIAASAPRDADSAAQVGAERVAAAAQQEADGLAAAQRAEEMREAARLEAARLEAARLQTQREEAERSAAQQEALRLEAVRKEAAQAEAARLQAQREEAERRVAQQREALRLETARKEAAVAQAARLQAQQEAARIEAARKEAARLEAARLQAQREEAERSAAQQREAMRLEAARKEAALAEAARLQAQQQAQQQAAARQAAEQIEAARQEAARKETARLEAAGQEKAQQEARREAVLRAIGQQLNEEAAQRKTASSSMRRGRLFGHTDTNAELIQYAQAWSRKIQLNMTFDMVREAARQPHKNPLVTVALRSDGSVESVTFVTSSGVAALDEAVRRIVHSQAPYPAFPPALAREYDVIEIRRTWSFDMAVRLY